MEAMRAKELVPILAEKFGVPFETAFVIDRALAENGLRAKGKGRSWPEMSRREAVHFLIGCMVATTVKTAVATRAAADVSLWVSASSVVNVTIDDAEQMAAVMVNAQEPSYEPEIICDRSKLLPFLKGMDGKSISLTDYLLRIMSDPFLMEDFDQITLSLSPSHLEAAVCFWQGMGEERSILDREVFYADGAEDIEPQNRIRTEISVGGRFLWEIATRTDDPFAEGPADG